MMKRGGGSLSNRFLGIRTTRILLTIIIDSMLYSFGDIVLLDYPFTNAVGSKRRPGLVLLSEDDGDILFARITSQDREGIWDMFIQDWSATGLLYPSVIRLSKMVSLEATLIKKEVGRLTVRDRDAVSAALHSMADSIR
jgi:mRNA interferase MazF